MSILAYIFSFTRKMTHVALAHTAFGAGRVLPAPAISKAWSKFFEPAVLGDVDVIVIPFHAGINVRIDTFDEFIILSLVRLYHILSSLRFNADSFYGSLKSSRSIFV